MDNSDVMVWLPKLKVMSKRKINEQVAEAALMVRVKTTDITKTNTIMQELWLKD